MWKRLFPWRYVISRLARRQGFVDPVALLSRLQRFSQPSEVTEPIELLRAGVVFHARGLLNARSIQHNLDWVWPYWVERQFDPRDPAFVPRAFSITHVNLTHRNWTAVGVPDCDWLPLVDPRGLVTPLYDGWSLDAWVIPDEQPPLLPSRTPGAEQHLELDDPVAVETRTAAGPARLIQRVDVVGGEHGPECRLAMSADCDTPAWLALTIRPVNPEGVSLVHDIRLAGDRRTLDVDGDARIRFAETPEAVHMSHYHAGDVRGHLDPSGRRDRVHCEVGMATAAALFRVQPGQTRQTEVRVPLAESDRSEEKAARRAARSGKTGTPWSSALAGVCRLSIPDPQMQFLFDAALHSLVLHAPGDVYPGPYTYKRFWFRDAAFIIDALLGTGLLDRARRCLDLFPERQSAMGYFHSQEGEWDSNGEALWIMDRYRRVTGRPLPEAWHRPVARGTRWIGHKRLADDLDAPHAGLMPAGFSAEHLGPNDHYYWDAFWSLAGLEAGAAMLASIGETGAASDVRREAMRLSTAIDRSLERAPRRGGRPAIPASPHRGLDAGAIGSLAAGYPLALLEADDPRLVDTAEFLLDNCMVDDGFFQDMIHSGTNAYLTLHIAQVLLRAGDPRHFRLVRALADMASPTGQWPEAIHPHTAGGCMGDGQHIWAAAEWVLMLRNLFLREEGDALVIGSGLPPEWLEPGRATLAIGPAPTVHGPVESTIHAGTERAEVHCRGQWHGAPPALHVRLAGFEDGTIPSGAESITLRRRSAEAR